MKMDKKPPLIQKMSRGVGLGIIFLYDLLDMFKFSFDDL